MAPDLAFVLMRSQCKHAKSQYRVRNWPEYEAGLRCRGDVTVWLSDAALDAWRAPASGKPGGQRTYADIAIDSALTIRMGFRFPPIPDHTTLSRRLTKLSGVRFPSGGR
jgi:Transposase DDE domain